MTSYEEKQEEWMKSLGLDEDSIIGKEFRVTRVAADLEDGWMNSWERSMTNRVGDIMTVVKYARRGGIQLEDRYRMGYPFFVLEPAWETKPHELVIGIV